MIRHYVAYSVGAVCDRSSEGACPQCKKPDQQVGLCDLAVREGFEPSIRCRIHTFQACSFSHSDTSPNF